VAQLNLSTEWGWERGLWVLKLLGVALGLGGCVYAPLGEGELGSSRHARVGRAMKTLGARTTAYTHTEPGGARNALGTRLRFGGEVSSAATDWSWMPVGTRFRIKETGRAYVVEDYGSALVGRQTIDLYMPNEAMVRAWGVRQVTVEVLEWGSPAMSRILLEPRRGTDYVRRMLVAMDGR
jgi:3D (Asp-Asp-Asp) domain-containing protein